MAAHVLEGIASALLAACAVIVVLMAAAWLHPATTPDWDPDKLDFPARYLFALLPALAAAWALRGKAEKLRG
jgi:hypothetical protein